MDSGPAESCLDLSSHDRLSQSFMIDCAVESLVVFSLVGSTYNWYLIGFEKLLLEVVFLSCRLIPVALFMPLFILLESGCSYFGQSLPVGMISGKGPLRAEEIVVSAAVLLLCPHHADFSLDLCLCVSCFTCNRSLWLGTHALLY